MVIAKVDAEAAEKIANKFGVEAYPTLIWYRAPFSYIAAHTIHLTPSLSVTFRFVGGKKVKAHVHRSDLCFLTVMLQACVYEGDHEVWGWRVCRGCVALVAFGLKV